MAVLATTPWLAAAGAALAAAVLGLRAWHRRDARAMQADWAALRGTAAPPGLPAHFDPALTDGLPEPARRFFAHVIAPGAALRTVAEFEMQGELALGTRQRPGWRALAARQVLAMPRGFVWQLHTLGGWPRLDGGDGLLDGRSCSCFWLQGLLPVARAGGRVAGGGAGGMDHLRSAFGRGVAEAVFWTPPALLPQAGARWEPVDADTARVTLAVGGLEQAVDLHVAPDGRPLWVRFERWSNANPARRWQLQPFGGTLADLREVDGIRVPFRVEAGNFFGTPGYFAFYRMRLRALRFAGRQR